MGNTSIRIRDIFFVVVISLLVLSHFIKSCSDSDNKKDKTVGDYKYNTDTIYVDQGYKDKYDDLLKSRIRGSKITPPKKQTIWGRDNLKGISLIKTRDSIKVKSQDNNIVKISDNYIKIFPTSNKLIDFSLNRDSLNITTIGIDGVTKTKDYPIYLNRFNYKWYDNELHHYKTNKYLELKNKLNQLYINGGYDIYSKKPLIGVEYFIILDKFKIEANSNLTIDNNTNINLNINLGYRLF